MTHFINFAILLTLVVVYFIGVYNFWLKKDKRHDKADAFLMTIATFFGTLLAELLIAAIWAVTK